MGRTDKEFEARMQGMRYAYNLVKVGMSRLGEVVVVALGGAG